MIGDDFVDPASASQQPEAVLQALVSAQRLHALYPARNPKVLEGLGKLQAALGELAGSVIFEVGREHMLHEAFPLLSHQNEVRELARKLYLASVTEVEIQPQVEEDELLHLFDLLRLSDDQRRDLGSLVDELQRRGVSHIVLHEAKHVKIETGGDGAMSDPWDLASLEELEALELTILGDGHSDGLMDSFRAAGDGRDDKAARLLGLLARPADFASLMLETASQHRSGGKINFDAQLAFVIELVSRLEPMLEKIPAADAARLYQQLEEVVVIIERGIYRELIEAGRPPYVRIGGILRLFQEGRIRPMTVKEALGLGLGLGLMPFLIGALRRITRGDENILAVLDGDFKAEEALPASYRPSPLPPASAARLDPSFFEPSAPGSRRVALANSLNEANSFYDSVATLLDLASQETDLESYGQLIDQLAARFTRALGGGNFVIASQVIRGFYDEWKRHTPAAGEPPSELRGVLSKAYDRCGSAEAMQGFAASLASVEPGAGIKQAAEPLTGLTRTAISALMDILGDEEDDSPQAAKLSEVIQLIGKRHMEAVLSFAVSPNTRLACRAVRILGGWAPDSLKHIYTLAKNQQAVVRKEVVHVLAAHRDDKSMEVLSGFVLDPDDSVVRDAVKQLVELGEPRALPALHKALESPKLQERHPATIAALVRALGVLGDDTSKRLLEVRGKEDSMASGRLKALFQSTADAIAAKAGEES